MNKQFEEWYINHLKDNGVTEDFEFHIERWHSLSFMFQWGVYLEFFDSVGIHVTVEYCVNENMLEWIYNILFDEYMDWRHSDYKQTRQEAQQEAIKKAFEILETQLKDNG